MFEVIRAKPFLSAMSAGALAQFIKVLTFLLIEKRLNYKRFVQTDGSPNMHSAAMTALTLSVGLIEGFQSTVFALSLCLSVLVMLDIINVKNAASRQAEILTVLVDRIRKKKDASMPSKRQSSAGFNTREGVSYSIADVLTGAALGAVIAFLVY